MEAKFLSRTADTQQRDPVTPDKAVLAQVLQRVTPAVVLGHHPQAGGAAIHRVGLFGKREGLHYFLLSMNSVFHFGTLRGNMDVIHLVKKINHLQNTSFRIGVTQPLFCSFTLFSPIQIN